MFNIHDITFSDALTVVGLYNHVSKSCDLFTVRIDNYKQVVGFQETKQCEVICHRLTGIQNTKKDVNLQLVFQY